MSRSLHLILLGLVPVCSLVFAGLLFLHRQRVYAAWAKMASIITLIAASGWAILGIVLLDWRSYHLTRDSYYKFAGIKGMLAGIAIGFSLSVLMARPYTKRQTETRSDQPAP